MKLEEITEPLLSWYEENKRDLPWRREPTPYHVWVSEIMLQQTRVEAVKDYYRRFLAELPGIRDLAACPENKLLKLWEGLGYYNRVKNMQKAAKEIVEEYGGNIPPDYEKILALPGIGSYTAGAVSSIAFGLKKPAVDGNVLRVISRITENGEDILKQSVSGAWSRNWKLSCQRTGRGPLIRASWSWGLRCVYRTVWQNAMPVLYVICAAPGLTVRFWIFRKKRRKNSAGLRKRQSCSYKTDRNMLFASVRIKGCWQVYMNFQIWKGGLPRRKC